MTRNPEREGEPFRFTLFGSGIKIAWGDDPLDYVILSAMTAKRMRRKLSEAISALAEVDGYRARIDAIHRNEHLKEG